jgi:hypothetical protein
VIQEWEWTEGRGLWVTAGRLIGSSVVAGGIFYLLTQDVSVQSLIPVVSGTGLFGTPIVRIASRAILRENRRVRSVIRR